MLCYSYKIKIDGEVDKQPTNDLVQDVVLYCGRAMGRNKLINMNVSFDYEDKKIEIELETQFFGDGSGQIPWEDARRKIMHDF